MKILTIAKNIPSYNQNSNNKIFVTQVKQIFTQLKISWGTINEFNL